MRPAPKDGKDVACRVLARARWHSFNEARPEGREGLGDSELADMTDDASMRPAPKDGKDPRGQDGERGKQQASMRPAPKDGKDPAGLGRIRASEARFNEARPEGREGLPWSLLRAGGDVASMRPAPKDGKDSPGRGR